MQTKNLILFFVGSALIMIGWSFFTNWMWPRREPAIRQLPPLADKFYSPKVQARVAVASLAASGFDGNALARVTAEVAVLAERLPSPPKVEPPPEIAQKPSLPQAKPETIEMGDESYNLQVKLHSKGAGVRQLILTQFEEATEMGRPAHKLLRLIPETYNPSFLLYHYRTPDDTRPEPYLADLVWTVKEKDAKPDAERQKVVFEAELPDLNLIVTKTFTLGRDDYHVGLTVGVRPKPGTKPTRKFRYLLDGAHGLPIEGIWYTYTFRNAMVGWVDSGNHAWRSLEDSRQIAHWNGGEAQVRGDRTIRYAAVAVQYFASAVVVDPIQPGGQSDQFLDRVRATPEGPLHEKRPELTDITVRLVTEPLAVDAKGIEQKYILYNGPVKVSQLGQLSPDKHQVSPERVDWYVRALHLDTLTDYHSPGWAGSFASSIGLTFLIIKFTNLMHWLLWNLNHVLPVWGLNIIMLTVLVRGLMFPISRRQAANTQQMQEKMARLAPEVKKLQEKYKDDPTALNQARMDLYMRNNVNPLSTLGGCLLLFAQMPIFMGLYYCLQESIHFRLQHFLWMPNLAAPDMLFEWGTWIPVVSDPASMGSALYLGQYFNLLPVIAVGLMIVQQKMMTPPPTDEQQEIQQKMMKWMMVVFGWMFYKMAAGMCMYFVASSLWGLCERRLLPKTKTTGAPGTPVPSAAPERSRSPADRRRQQRDRREAERNGGTLQKLRHWWEEVLEQARKK